MFASKIISDPLGERAKIPIRQYGSYASYMASSSLSCRENELHASRGKVCLRCKSSNHDIFTLFAIRDENHVISCSTVAHDFANFDSQELSGTSSLVKERSGCSPHVQTITIITKILLNQRMYAHNPIEGHQETFKRLRRRSVFVRAKFHLPKGFK